MRRTILIVTIGLVMTLTSVADAVSPAGAFFRSLIVPGWGQYALGKTDRALLFGGTEAALWLGVGWMSHLESTYTDTIADTQPLCRCQRHRKSRDYFRRPPFYDREHSTIKFPVFTTNRIRSSIASKTIGSGRQPRIASAFARYTTTRRR